MIGRKRLDELLRWMLLPPLVMLVMVVIDPTNARLHPYALPSAITVAIIVSILFYLRKRPDSGG